MKVLYLPQLSMRSYEDNRWLVQSDAQAVKMRHYVRALPEDWEWLWLLPQLWQLDSHRPSSSVNRELREFLPGNVRFVHVPWMDNVLQGRYFLPMRELFSVVGEFDPDVMLLEVPEHARAMRVVQQWLGTKFSIISMVEHVDFYEQTRVPEQVGYTLRQVDGALVSNAVAFPLEGMRQEWLKAATDHVRIEDVELLRHKHVVWPALFSPDEVSTVAGVEAHGEVPVINFISRLSDNQRTHYEEFFAACRLLWDYGELFEVWVMNPNEAQSEEWIREQGPFVKIAGQPKGPGIKKRAWYLAHLWQSDIVPILYPQSHIYSLGFCEAVASRNLIFTQHVRGAEVPIVPGISREKMSVEYIAEGLRRLVHLTRMMNADGKVASTVSEHLDRAVEWLMQTRSVERNIDKVRATIEGVVR